MLFPRQRLCRVVQIIVGQNFPENIWNRSFDLYHHTFSLTDMTHLCFRSHCLVGLLYLYLDVTVRQRKASSITIYHQHFIDESAPQHCTVHCCHLRQAHTIGFAITQIETFPLFNMSFSQFKPVKTLAEMNIPNILQKQWWFFLLFLTFIKQQGRAWAAISTENKGDAFSAWKVWNVDL